MPLDWSISRRQELVSPRAVDSLRPNEEWTMGNPRIHHADDSKLVGGVYAIMETSLRLFNLRPPSRRMPDKEWKIPLPSVQQDCDFYPAADVIAFVGRGRGRHVCKF